MKVGSRWVRVLLHRFLLDAPTGVMVDHKNGNGLDCTRGNLRVANRNQKQHNSGPRNGTSRFKGVYRKTKNRWAAQIKARQTYRYLGLFATEEDAASAYDEAAKELHGEFARLNFPDDTPRAEMRRELLAEVERELVSRIGEPIVTS